MKLRRGPLRVSVGPWCWGALPPRPPEEEEKTRILNCPLNRGRSSGTDRALSFENVSDRGVDASDRALDAPGPDPDGSEHDPNGSDHDVNG